MGTHTPSMLRSAQLSSAEFGAHRCMSSSDRPSCCARISSCVRRARVCAYPPTILPAARFFCSISFTSAWSYLKLWFWVCCSRSGDVQAAAGLRFVVQVGV